MWSTPRGRDSIKIRSKPMFLRWSRLKRGDRSFSDGGLVRFTGRCYASVPFFSPSLAVAGEKGDKKESSGKNDGPLATVVRDQVSLLPTTLSEMYPHTSNRPVLFLCVAPLDLSLSLRHVNWRWRWLSFWRNVSFVNVIVSRTS